jgi:hypothetical protein
MTQSVPEWAAAAVVALAGIAIGFRRLVRINAVEKLAAGRADAENQVVALLRSELVRMSEQNGVLATELNTLQLRIVELSTQHQLMASVNAKLTAQVEELRGVIEAMRSSGCEAPHDSAR